MYTFQHHILFFFPLNLFTVLHNDPAVPTVQYKCGRYRIQTRDQVHRNESLNNSGAPEAWNYWQKVSVLFISIFCLSYLVKKEKNTHCTLAIAFKELWDHLCCLYFYYSKIPILLDYNINTPRAGSCCTLSGWWRRWSSAVWAGCSQGSR